MNSIESPSSPRIKNASAPIASITQTSPTESSNLTSKESTCHLPTPSTSEIPTTIPLNIEQSHLGTIKEDEQPDESGHGSKGRLIQSVTGGATTTDSNSTQTRRFPSFSNTTTSSRTMSQHSSLPSSIASSMYSTSMTFDDFQRFSQFDLGWNARVNDSGSVTGSSVGHRRPLHFTFTPLEYEQQSHSQDASRLPTAANTPRASLTGELESGHQEVPATAAEFAPDEIMKLKEETKATVKAAERPMKIKPHYQPSSIWACVLQATFGGAIYGYNTAIIAGLTNPLINHLYFPSSSANFQATMAGVLVSCILLGGFFGTMLSLPLANRFGRRVGFIVSGLLCVGACVGMAFVDNFVGLVLLRTVLGISVGMTTTVCPLYNAECSPVSNRGAIGTVFQIALVTAILIGQVVNYAFNPSESTTIPVWSWHVQFLLGGIFGCGLIIMGLIVPESPVWMAHRAKRQQSQLDQRHRREFVRRMSKEVEQGELPPPSTTPSTTTRRNNLTISTHTTTASIAHTPTIRKGWRGLFHLSNARWAALAFLLAAANQLTGINAVIYYAPQIFRDAGYPNKALILTIAVVGSWNLVTAVCSIPLIRALSRRTLLLIAHGIMAVGLALITIVFAFFPEQRAIPSIIAILLFILGFEIGPGPLFFILASEAFPNEILHAGLSLANSSAWMCNILITFLFPLLNVAIGGAATFFIFLVICLGAILGYHYLLPTDTERHVITADESPIEPISSLAKEDDEDEDGEDDVGVCEVGGERGTDAGHESERIELMPSPPVFHLDRTERKELDSSPPYQAKAQNQLPQQWTTDTATTVNVKHPMQSPLYGPIAKV